MVSKSELCSYCVIASKTAYLSYNVYRNNLFVLRRVLDEKKRFDTEERKTALLLRDTAFKLLCLKD